MSTYTWSSWARSIGLGISLILLISCASAGIDRDVREVKSTTEKALKESKSRKELPLEFLERPILVVDTKSLSKVPIRRFDFHFVNVPLKSVLSAMCRDAGLNLYIDPTIKDNPRVTLDLKNVTFKKALEYLLRPFKLLYRIDGNILWVYKEGFVTEVFKIRTVNIERSSSVSSSISGAGSEGTGESEAVSQGGLSVSISVSNKFSAWKDIACNVCSILGLSCSGSSDVVCSGEGQMVSLNRSTGHLIVTAKEEKMPKVKDYLLVAEESMRKQVMLEVKMLEVSLRRTQKLGIDWKAVFSALNDFSMVFTNPAFPAGLFSLITLKKIVKEATPQRPPSEEYKVHPRFSEKYGKGTSYEEKTTNFMDVIIKALKKQGDVVVISNPRLTVMNNQMAVIKAGKDMKFVSDVTIVKTAENETQPVCDVDMDTYFVGVSLALTPYVDERGYVTLYLHPSVTELKDVKEYRSGCGDVSIQEPVFEVREVDTMVSVKSGDTLVIGGLIKREGYRTRYKVPYLGDIPGLGNAFRSEEYEGGNTELVILITPYIVEIPEKKPVGTITPIGMKFEFQNAK